MLFFENISHHIWFIDINTPNDYTSTMGRAVFGAIIAAIIIKLFLFDLILADGDSMSPAIKNGTVLVINRLQYGLRFPGQQAYLVRWASPKPGEVVVFYTPDGELAVKRCEESMEQAFFALGDNSLQSYDSRSYGVIPAENAIGRVLGIK
jgi:signal peptidase I